MADPQDVTTLILMVGPDLLTSQEFEQLIDLNDDNLNLAAAQVWEIRAGKYHGLVDISESGSSRKMSDMHKNALALAAMYRGKETTVEPEVPDSAGVTRTRRIVRE